VTEIQSELDQVSRDLEQTTDPATRPTLAARHDKLVAELNLAKARQDVLQNLADFSTDNAGPEGLLQKINDLENSIGDQAAPQPAGAPKPAASAAVADPQSFRPESAGLLGLVTEMFSLSQRMSELKKLAQVTATLQQGNQKLRDPIRNEFRDASRRSDALRQAGDSNDPKALDAQRQELETLTARFQLLAGTGVPLSKQNAFLETTHASLLDWRTSLGQTYSRVLRTLLVRLGAMLLATVIVLLISIGWRRATFRYVHDARRRRQFLLIRRLVIGGIIVIIIVAGIVTELSTLATFAGIITAGIAVALQTVILSGVAHFFFMGRYGVRVGDRVTISGITGDVIDIGVFRLYLLELAGKPTDLQPTGRIVVFSNSVLFQPSAFFKQIPGADYNWHELALTLSPDSDYHLAEQRLLGAVQAVYGEYRQSIEQQHAGLRDSIKAQMPKPEPEGRLRFVDAGLEFVVRFPVEIRRAADIDDRMTRKLLDTIANEPKLKLVATSTPKIQPTGTN
jgi:small-conductance mechanosensitive channel